MQTNSDLLGHFLCLQVQVVPNFYMLTDESDGDHHYVFAALLGQIGQHIADIRFQTGLSRRTAATLIGHRPIPMTLSATARAAPVNWDTYGEPSAMDLGRLWAVKTTGVALCLAGGTSERASVIVLVTASIKRG